MHLEIANSSRQGLHNCMHRHAFFFFATIVMILIVTIRLWNVATPNFHYFDEVRYVPAAKVLMHLDAKSGHIPKNPIINKSPDQNFAHPPLGKLFIGWSILAFGDVPWAWRLPSLIFGLLCLPLFFVLSKNLTARNDISILATVFMAFDGLQIVGSRIAMLDIPAQFFILAFMLSLVKLREQPNSRSWIFIASLSICLAMSVKLTSFFVVVPFFILYLAFARATWRNRLVNSVYISAVSFGLYSLWAIYFSFYGYTYWEWLQYHFFTSQKVLLLTKTHPGSSFPWEWFSGGGAVWYYFKIAPILGIIGIGNAILYPLAVPATCYLAFRAYKHRHFSDSLPVLWMILSLVPLFYVYTKRIGFVFHIIPSTPAMYLALSICLFTGFSSRKLQIASVAIVTSSLTLYLIFFLPFLLGIPVCRAWLDLFFLVIPPPIPIG